MNPALDSRARFEAWSRELPNHTPNYIKRFPKEAGSAAGKYFDPVTELAWEAWQAAIASMAVIDPETGCMSSTFRDLIEGMSVSVDVSTGDHDAGHRYFGTVTEVMDDPTDKHCVTLLVQDAEPNFTPPIAALAAKETT